MPVSGTCDAIVNPELAASRARRNSLAGTTGFLTLPRALVANLVDLDDADAARAAGPGQDRGIGAGLERHEDRRFLIVGRREAARRDRGRIGRIPPVVV